MPESPGKCWTLRKKERKMGGARQVKPKGPFRFASQNTRQTSSRFIKFVLKKPLRSRRREKLCAYEVMNGEGKERDEFSIRLAKAKQIESGFLRFRSKEGVREEWSAQKNVSLIKKRDGPTRVLLSLSLSQATLLSSWP